MTTNPLDRSRLPRRRIGKILRVAFVSLFLLAFIAAMAGDVLLYQLADFN